MDGEEDSKSGEFEYMYQVLHVGKELLDVVQKKVFEGNDVVTCCS